MGEVGQVTALDMDHCMDQNPKVDNPLGQNPLRLLPRVTWGNGGDKAESAFVFASLLNAIYCILYTIYYILCTTYYILPVRPTRPRDSGTSPPRERGREGAHYTILYYTILYYTILYCTVLYYVLITVMHLHSVVNDGCDAAGSMPRIVSE